MEADWELVERSKSINALAVGDATRADMETAKGEGNAFFQRQLFADAVRKYSLVVDWCLAQRVARSGDPNDSLAALEVAVRLNRALALIELKDFRVAESDCSAVLADQPDCVKALYRRALAREQLGSSQAALDDLSVLLKNEPANPAALTLLSRLRVHETSSTAPAAGGIVQLSKGLSQCSVSTATGSRFELAVAAEQAWSALQDEELRVRQSFQSKKPPVAPVLKKPRQVSSASKSAVVAPAKASKNQREHEDSAAFRCKTDGVWESLAQEELRTVVKVFPKRRASEPHSEA